MSVTTENGIRNRADNLRDFCCDLLLLRVVKTYLKSPRREGKMKASAFLILFAGVLISSDNVTQASGSDEGNRKSEDVKEEIAPPRPNFPLFSLPSLSSFSLPGLNFPYLQALSHPNRKPQSDRIRATKTEYVEVTRRQTVHPVCYTAYEAKAPCLPYAQSDFQEEDYYDNSDVEAVHQTHDSFHLNEVKRVSQSAPESEASEQQDSTRTGKYLELKLRRNGPPETSTRLEGSEFFPILNRVPPQQQAPEYHTKTVLVTKLEKYTDRRVTATLLAVNCLPVDRSIPMCQTKPNPIREAPGRRSDTVREEDYNPTSVGGSESVIPSLGATGNKTKPTVIDVVESDSEEPLLGEE